MLSIIDEISLSVPEGMIIRNSSPAYRIGIAFSVKEDVMIFAASMSAASPSL